MTSWIKTHWPNLVLIFIPLLAGIIFWDRLPEELPTHWNLKGEVDDTMPKEIAIFLLPFTMIMVNAIFWIIPVLDPKQMLEHSQKPIYAIQVGVNLLLCFLGLLIIAFGLGQEIDMTTVVPSGILILFLVLGNFMGKIRPNYFIGIRTPWTLESDDVWRKTHKLTGWIWVGASLGLMGISWLLRPEVFFFVFLGGVAAMTLVPVIYSYLEFRKQKMS